MTAVNPPPQPRLPQRFVNDNEVRTYFDQIQRILLQLWQKVGGADDPTEDLKQQVAELDSRANLGMALLSDYINRDLFFYTDSVDLAITTPGAIVSAKTETNDVTITIPDIANVQEGDRFTVVHYEGNFNVIVTTQSGTDNIGNALTQTIQQVGKSITVVAQKASGSPEYLIIQDSRGSLSNRVVLTKASDFNITFDSTKEYWVDGVIDIGSQTIEVPTTGLFLRGYGFGVSGITSSANSYTMFTSPIGGSGNLFISDVEITVSGTGSKVFDVNDATGFNALELNTVNFNDCTEIGIIDAYRQFLANNMGMFDCDDGFTFEGTWLGGARIETTIIRDFTTGGTVFSKGSALSFGSRFVCNANILIPSGATAFNFDATNFSVDASYNIIGAIVDGGGSALSGTADETNTVSRFTGNTGVPNTYVGSAWELTSAATTTISVVSTPVKIAGTTTYSDQVWMSNTTDNAFVWDSTLTGRVDIIGSISFSGSANRSFDLLVRKWDDSAAGYVLLNTFPFTTNGGTAGTRAENVSFISTSSLDINDRIELWVQNNSDTTNVTCDLGGKVVISERQS